MKKLLVRLGAFLVPFMIVVTFVVTFASAATVSPITSMSVADDTYTPVNEITTDNLYHITINWESTASPPWQKVTILILPCPIRVSSQPHKHAQLKLKILTAQP